MADSLISGSGVGTREWREDFVLKDSTGLNAFKVPQAGTGEVVINDGSRDLDFRVESDGNANALFVDASTNRVGILNAAPAVALDVTGAITCSGTLTAAATALSGDLNLGSGKFTVAAASGNTSTQGTLAATGALSLGNLVEMTEISAPAAPTANGVRIYAVDNGAGKTQLMALFQSGAAQQLAIEP